MPEIEAKPGKSRILLQLDTDPTPSVFDAVVALDSGVDHLLQVGGAKAGEVAAHVHGLIFTRGGDDLRRSAIFVGGSDASAGEAVLAAVTKAFFGPLRVSVLLDGRGANTTATAAVLALEQSLGGPIDGGAPPSVVVLGAGPVGTRVARLLANLGAGVALGTPDPAEVIESVDRFLLEPGWEAHCTEATALVAAGPAGVAILSRVGRDVFPNLRVAVDLNAVPPAGLGNVKPGDADRDRDGVRVWGPIGVGNLKMRVHKASVRALFDADPVVLDLTEVFAIGRRVVAAQS